MSEAKLIGRVHLIDSTKSYGQKGFRKRMVVIEQDNGRFANYIPVEFTNDGCDTVDDLKVGEEVEVGYRLSGRKWQKDPSSEVKYFLSAEATGFRRLGAGANAPTRDPNEQLNEASYSDDDPVF